jgi:hypothetical protein
VKPLPATIFAIVLGCNAFGQPRQISQPDRIGPHMEQIIREAGLDLQNPTEAALKKAGSLLQSAEKKGIWLVAPSPLAIDENKDSTIFGFDYFSTRQRGQRYFRKSAVIVGTRVESRETFAQLAFEPKEKDPAKAKESSEDDRASDIDVLLRFNVRLRDRLEDLPWRAGTYIVDVLFDTETSNRARFKLTSGAAADKDPAVATFIEAQKTTAGAPRKVQPAQGQPYPNYHKNEKSLAIPAENDISLEAERVAIYKPDGHSVLKGSFRLPVPAAFNQADGTTVVPITLVITGNLMTGPFVSPLFIPTIDKIDPKATESVVTGQFEIDLFALKETSKVPQTYTIWAYSGDVRSAPATAAFITPEMLQ